MNLNQECIMLQNELRKFAQQVMSESVDELDKSCSLPLDSIKQLAEMGILGAIIPEQFGGAALDTIGLVVSLEEISKICTSTAIIVATHNAFFTYPILTFAGDDTKKKYLPSAATGDLIGGFANADTNEIRIEKKEDNFVLNGNNPFVLNAQTNGPFTLFLPHHVNDKEMTALIVDRDMDGIAISKNSSIIGLKAAGIGKVQFENYILSSGNIIGNENEGNTIMLATNDYAKVCLSAIALGIAQGAADAAIKYAKERVQFNEPIINFGMVREKIAETATMIEAARFLTYEAASQCDAGKNFHRAAAIAKYYAGHAAVEITNQAIQIFGGYGYIKDYPVERYFRDALVINVLCNKPANEKEIIAKETIG